MMLCYAGESSLEVKVEADSSDMSEHPHDDKPRPYVCTVCDKRSKTEFESSPTALCWRSDVYVYSVRETVC